MFGVFELVLLVGNVYYDYMHNFHTSFPKVGYYVTLQIISALGYFEPLPTQGNTEEPFLGIGLEVLTQY